LDGFAAARNALNVMTRDVNLAFHYFDLSEEVKNQIGNDMKTKGQQPPWPTEAQQLQNNSNYIPTEKLTAFIGSDDSLYFTALSNERTITNSPESDQAKVSYFIKGVKSVRTKENTQALIRRMSPILDGDVKKGGEESVLIEDVKKLSFRYLYPIQDKEFEWTSSWDSTKGDDARQTKKFPEAVEITLTVLRNKKEVKLSTIAAIHMTNNDPMKSASPSASPGAGGGQAPPPNPFGGAGGFPK
jgi:hypothetical protein